MNIPQNVKDEVALMELDRDDTNKLKLPAQQLPSYTAVKKLLTGTCGGKYHRGGFFTFPEPAALIQDRIVRGEQRDTKKELQQFDTSEDLGNEMIEALELELDELREHSTFLEPSAGTGILARLFLEKVPTATVQMVEIDNARVDKLITADWLTENTWIENEDFINDFEAEEPFDYILMNPPFTKNQDVDHVTKAFHLLAPGGRLVAIMSPSWTFGQQKKQEAFRQLVEEHSWRPPEKIEEGAFKKSGTNVRTVMVFLQADE